MMWPRLSTKFAERARLQTKGVKVIEAHGTFQTLLIPERVAVAR